MSLDVRLDRRRHEEADGAAGCDAGADGCRRDVEGCDALQAQHVPRRVAERLTTRIVTEGRFCGNGDVLDREPRGARRLVFAVGWDAFREIGTWKEHTAIFATCDVVVVTRPPGPTRLTIEDIPVAAKAAFCYDPSSESFRHASGHVLSLQRITALDISAAAIRAHVAAGRSIGFLVPAAVETYIEAHRLYRPGDVTR